MPWYGSGCASVLRRITRDTIERSEYINLHILNRKMKNRITIFLCCLVNIFLAVDTRCEEIDDNGVKDQFFESHKSMILEMWKKVVIKRSIDSSAFWFCELDEYLKINDDILVESRKFNHREEIKSYFRDCEALIDDLPKINTDFIQFSSIERIQKDGFVNGYNYKVVFTVGEGTDRLGLIFPTIVNTKSGPKFATRFGSLYHSLR